MGYSVDSVVCDYGVFDNDKLALICNSRKNAFLIKAIMEKDCSEPNKVTTFLEEDFKEFEEQYSERPTVDVTKEFKGVIESLECDFDLALQGEYKFSNLDDLLEKKDEKLMQDMQAIGKLSYLLRYGKARIVMEE